MGLIVEELGSAVEVGRVVLVSLDDEAVSGAVVEARGKVAGRAADQVAGIAAASGTTGGSPEPVGARSVRWTTLTFTFG